MWNITEVSLKYHWTKRVLYSELKELMKAVLQVQKINTIKVKNLQ
jgi:hypothetical protein